MFPGKVAGSPATFRPDKVGTVREGLPSLLEQMEAAWATTPRRKAGWLTTVAFESLFEYNIHQFNDTRPYAGRGYFQLTGEANYKMAGDYLGVDLVADPDLARSLEWSAKIARWYWTSFSYRPFNKALDQLKFGLVCKYMGYPLVTYADGTTNDQARCKVFARALGILTGEPTPPIDCSRGAVLT